MRILVTGSLGTIGRHLVPELRSRGHEVFGCDLYHHADEHASHFQNDGTYMKCDVSEYRQVEATLGYFEPEMVYHAAAEFGRWNGEDFCVTIDTPVLKSDLTWTAAGDLKVGDELIGFDEVGNGAPAEGSIPPLRRRRRLRRATVLAADRKIAPVYRITLVDGTVLRSTAEHRWLMVTQLDPAEPGFWASEHGHQIMQSVEKAQGRFTSEKIHAVALANKMSYGQVASAYYNYHKKNWKFSRHPAVRPTRPLEWVRTDELGQYVNSQSGLPRLFEVVQSESSYQSGYVAAAFDGEGHVRKSVMDFSQVRNKMLDRMRCALSEMGIAYTEGRLGSKGRCQPCFYLRVNGRKDVNRLLMLTRPARLLPRWIDRFLIGTTASSRDVVGIAKVEPDGEAEIAAIRSSTKTYIASGFGAHNTEQLWRTNVIGTKHILRLQETMGFRLVHFSSSEVYGDMETVLHEKFSPYALLNDYAMTKWVNEQQIRNSGGESVVVRLFNTYGPGEHYSPYRSVNCQFLYRAMKGLPLVVHAGHKRTSSYVTDTVRTLANISDRWHPGTTYNIAGEEVHSIAILADLACRAMDRPLDYDCADPEPMTTAIKMPDCTLAKRDLEHSPIISLERGMRLTAEWMRKEYGM